MISLNSFAEIEFFHDSEKGFDEIKSLSSQTTLFRPVILVKNSNLDTIQYKMITPIALNSILNSVEEILKSLSEKISDGVVDKNFIPCHSKTSVFNTRLVTEHIHSLNNGPTPYDAFLVHEKLRHLGIILSNAKCKEDEIVVKLSFQTSGTWPNFTGSISLSEFKNKNIIWHQELD